MVRIWRARHGRLPACLYHPFIGWKARRPRDLLAGARRTPAGAAPGPVPSPAIAAPLAAVDLPFTFIQRFRVDPAREVPEG